MPSSTKQKLELKLWLKLENLSQSRKLCLKEFMEELLTLDFTDQHLDLHTTDHLTTTHIPVINTDYHTDLRVPSAESSDSMIILVVMNTKTA
jgi:hypothetical protein